MLLTTLGGTSYDWASPQILGLGVDRRRRARSPSCCAESRAAEPILPLRLFRNRVFRVTSAIGFVIGFALFGALTYLPLFQQVVRGDSPTESGLQLLPVMAGVLLGSIGSGQVDHRHRPLQGLPDRRHRDRGGRHAAAVAAGRRHLDALRDRRDVRAWASGSGWSCRCSCSPCRTPSTTPSSASPPPARRCSARWAARSARRCSARSSRTASTNELAGSPAERVERRRDRPERAAAAAGRGPRQLHGRLHRRAHDRLPRRRRRSSLVAFVLSWLIEERPLRQTVETAGVGEAFASPVERRLAERAHARARPPRRPPAHARLHRAHGRRRRRGPAAGRGVAARAGRGRAPRSATPRRSPTAARSMPPGCASSSTRSPGRGLLAATR